MPGNTILIVYLREEHAIGSFAIDILSCFITEQNMLCVSFLSQCAKDGLNHELDAHIKK